LQRLYVDPPRPNCRNPTDSAARYEESEHAADDPEVLGGPHQGRTTFNFNWAAINHDPVVIVTAAEAT
jgi:hypothetical protein